MEITSDMIKKLREKTGAGMMDCKRALESTGGDMDTAIEYLRKKGAAIGQKRSDRAAKEGVIVTRVGNNAKTGVVVEVNCETDFVGRSEDFIGFAQAVAEAIELHKPQTVDAIPGLASASGKKVADLMNDVLAKVAEKVDIRRFQVFESNNGIVSSYTHLGNRIGVLVELEGVPAGSSVARDVAMQIAAMNPAVITRDQVDKKWIDREMDIYRTQAKNEGKPPQIQEKIAQGRLEKFYQEVVLTEQTFIKDPGKTVKDILREANPAQTVAVRRFQRFHLGEETT
ncbi:MAG: Elongation factor Ts [Bacteroidetes bacterium]|nr:Elongation factor Ts [Bacteroidota bacterium]